jgi:ribonuclease BN (tRNA processing enzyme)
MTIRVLGCAGSIAAGCRTTAFLLDDNVLIDAGSGVGDLPLDELARIDHILLSHSHLDHILSVALLADSVRRIRQRDGRPPIQVHALEATLNALHTHVFNNVIWPDFTRLPSVDRPALVFQPFAIGDVVAIGDRRIEVLSALHTVPAVGFAVLPSGASAAGAWVYTGDTAPNPALWARLNALPIRQLVIETAFSNDESELADISGHLSPAALAGELAHLGERPIEVFVTHIKPGELDAVMAEVAAIGCRHAVKALVTGQRMPLDCVEVPSDKSRHLEPPKAGHPAPL